MKTYKVVNMARETVAIFSKDGMYLTSPAIGLIYTPQTDPFKLANLVRIDWHGRPLWDAEERIAVLEV